MQVMIVFHIQIHREGILHRKCKRLVAMLTVTDLTKVILLQVTYQNTCTCQWSPPVCSSWRAQSWLLLLLLLLLLLWGGGGGELREVLASIAEGVLTSTGG